MPYSGGKMLASKIAYSARNSAGGISPSLNLAVRLNELETSPINNS